ncbi:MAG: YiiX/YebB-like N1pC/P60 family cysteine hydrolase [Ferruginibacter sp.]
MKFLCKKFIRQFLYCLIFLPLLFSCRQKTAAAYEISTPDSMAQQAMANRAFDAIGELEKSIKPGDLVTRTGNDFTSQSLRTLNRRDKTWSHCGIALIENNRVYVLHALGGEFNPDQKIRKDPFVVFAEPYSNKGIGVYRYNISTDGIEQLIGNAKKFYNEGILFDMEFNLTTDDRLYCSEFAWKSLQTPGSEISGITESTIKDFHFIGVDDLILHPKCSLVKTIVYK